ncbi:hypothetical protein ACW5R3_04460 [Bizionia sp. KMM 8389]
MIKKISILFVLFITFQTVFSQSELDSYKYVIVPVSYDFTSEPDQFKLNSLSQFLFEKYGFEAIMSNEPLPQDLINNGCLALRSDVIKESTMFVTKLTIVLKNCNQEIVYTSAQGTSREKKFQVAYNYALREAFDSFKTLNYSYKPTEAPSLNVPVPVQASVAPVAVSTSAVADSENTTNDVLTAVAKGLDYELVNAKSEVVYTLIYSGKPEFYMVKDLQATVYKQNGKWVMVKKLADGSLNVSVLNTDF